MPWQKQLYVAQPSYDSWILQLALTFQYVATEGQRYALGDGCGVERMSRGIEARRYRHFHVILPPYLSWTDSKDEFGYN